MLSYKGFIAEALRQGIPHIHHDNPNAPTLTSRVSTAHSDLHGLIGSGKVSGKVTEKTDGSAFKMGHDKKGFYTQTSRSDKMRNRGDYMKAAKKKFGDNVDPSISKHFDDLHHHFHSNKKLQTYLGSHAQKHGEASMSGEAFYHPMGTHSDDGKSVTYVGTKYSKKKIGGKKGAFVVHSQVKGNENHNHGSLSGLNTPDIHFHHDGVDNHADVDVSKERKELEKIDPVGIKRKNDPRHALIKDIAKRVHGKVAKAVQQNKPKFGDESEGHVVHGSTRVKIVNPNFAKTKAANKRFEK